MRRSFVLTTLVIATVIALAIFQRDLLTSIFTSEPDPVEVQEAKEQFSDAVKAVEDGEKSIDNAQKALADLEAAQSTKIKAVEVAQARLDDLLVSRADAQAAVEEAKDRENLLVEVVVSQAQPVRSGISLSGSVEAGRRIDLRAETSGTVQSQKIPAGRKILEGEAICAIDAGARADNLQTARTQRDATQRLFNEGLASAVALQNAQANFQAAQDEFERSVIRAPFTGITLSDTPDVGSSLGAGGLCVAFGNLDELVIVGYASESQVDQIKIGADAAAQFNNGKATAGVISNVGDTADPVTRTFRVEMTLPNTAEVRDGASAKMTIGLDETPGHLLPQNAIILSPEGLLGIQSNENNFARFLPVTYLRDVDEGVWVTDIPDTVEVIVTGQDYIVDGQKIRVEYRGDDPEATAVNEAQN